MDDLYFPHGEDFNNGDDRVDDSINFEDIFGSAASLEGDVADCNLAIVQHPDNSNANNPLSPLNNTNEVGVICNLGDEEGVSAGNQQNFDVHENLTIVQHPDYSNVNNPLPSNNTNEVGVISDLVDDPLPSNNTNEVGVISDLVDEEGVSAGNPDSFVAHDVTLTNGVDGVTVCSVPSKGSRKMQKGFIVLIDYLEVPPSYMLLPKGCLPIIPRQHKACGLEMVVKAPKRHSQARPVVYKIPPMPPLPEAPLGLPIRPGFKFLGPGWGYVPSSSLHMYDGILPLGVTFINPKTDRRVPFDYIITLPEDTPNGQQHNNANEEDDEHNNATEEHDEQPDSHATM